MTTARSDAFVFFGATGDLAFKQIFPALHALIRDDGFDVPIIGVSRSADLDSLRERARESLAAHGEADPEALSQLLGRLRYVKGSYDDAETFRALRVALGDAVHPLHYLAIPPQLFEQVIANLDTSGCAEGARVILEKPFGRDLISASALNAATLAAFPEPANRPSRQTRSTGGDSSTVRQATGYRTYHRLSVTERTRHLARRFDRDPGR